MVFDGGGGGRVICIFALFFLQLLVCMLKPVSTVPSVTTLTNFSTGSF